MVLKLPQLLMKAVFGEAYSISLSKNFEPLAVKKTVLSLG